jgi:hypothetical protein
MINLILLFGAYFTEAIQARWKSEKPFHFIERLEISIS